MKAEGRSTIVFIRPVRRGSLIRLLAEEARGERRGPPKERNIRGTYTAADDYQLHAGEEQ